MSTLKDTKSSVSDFSKTGENQRTASRLQQISQARYQADISSKSPQLHIMLLFFHLVSRSDQQISKDLLTLIIILVQLSTTFPSGSSKPINATEGYNNFTEDYVAVSYDM